MSGYFKNGPRSEEPPAKPKSEYNPYAEVPAGLSGKMDVLGGC